MTNLNLAQLSELIGVVDAYVTCLDRLSNEDLLKLSPKDCSDLLLRLQGESQDDFRALLYRLGSLELNVDVLTGIMKSVEFEHLVECNGRLQKNLSDRTLRELPRATWLGLLDLLTIPLYRCRALAQIENEPMDYDDLTAICDRSVTTDEDDHWSERRVRESTTREDREQTLEFLLRPEIVGREWVPDLVKLLVEQIVLERDLNEAWEALRILRAAQPLFLAEFEEKLIAVVRELGKTDDWVAILKIDWVRQDDWASAFATRELVAVCGAPTIDELARLYYASREPYRQEVLAGVFDRVSCFSVSEFVATHALDRHLKARAERAMINQAQTSDECLTARHYTTSPHHASNLLTKALYGPKSYLDHFRLACQPELSLERRQELLRRAIALDCTKLGELEDMCQTLDPSGQMRQELYDTALERPLACKDLVSVATRLPNDIFEVKRAGIKDRLRGCGAETLFALGYIDSWPVHLMVVELLAELAQTAEQRKKACEQLVIPQSRGVRIDPLLLEILHGVESLEEFRLLRKTRAGAIDRVFKRLLETSARLVARLLGLTETAREWADVHGYWDQHDELLPDVCYSRLKGYETTERDWLYVRDQLADYGVSVSHDFVWGLSRERLLTLLRTCAIKGEIIGDLSTRGSNNDDELISEIEALELSFEAWMRVAQQADSQPSDLVRSTVCEKTLAAVENLEQLTRIYRWTRNRSPTTHLAIRRRFREMVVTEGE